MQATVACTLRASENFGVQPAALYVLQVKKARQASGAGAVYKSL